MTDELKTVISIARQAGKILSNYYGKDLTVEFKQDEFDPVTQVDKEADKYIRNSLEESFPDDEILSEENDARPLSYEKRVWMVDPLDGTKDFVGGRETFSVIIGLLQNKVPKLGVVYNPITKELFYGLKDAGSFREFDGQTSKLHVSDKTRLEDTVLVTRNLVEGDVRPLDKQINALDVKDRLPEGSIGLKLGRIAQGKADVFVHTNLHACKWDTLAAQVIISEAGGVVVDLEGSKLDYTKDEVGWDKYVVAASNAKLIEQILRQIKLP